MGWWFGRKSAVPDARALVPDWLKATEVEEGFARSDRHASWGEGRALSCHSHRFAGIR